MAKLRQALESPAWPVALAGLPGCMPARSGQVLSLTPAVRGLHFRVAKPAVAGLGKVLAGAVFADQGGSTA